MENIATYAASIKGNVYDRLWRDTVRREMRDNIRGTVSPTGVRLIYRTSYDWLHGPEDRKKTGLIWANRVNFLNKHKSIDFTQWDRADLEDFLDWRGERDYINLKGFPFQQWLDAIQLQYGWEPVPYLTKDLTLPRIQALHWSLVEPKQVAYYPTLNHALQGREVRTSLGKYLRKHAYDFGLTENGEPSDKLVKDLHDKIMRRVGYDANPDVHFIEHDDKMGWTRVYHDGPHSCMEGESCVHVYAHEKSVLRLAYLTDPEDPDVITARAIVREDEKKGYLRVYPDPDNGPNAGSTLLNALSDLGYGERINLDGVLLDYEESGRSDVVCPYIDRGRGGSQTVSVIHRDGRQYLLAGGAAHEATETSGYIEITEKCGKCGCRCDVDEITYIAEEGEDWCNSCRDRDYEWGYCSQTSNDKDWIRWDDSVYCHTDGEYYRYPDAHDVYRCDCTDNFYYVDDLRSTSRGWVHEDHVIALDVGDVDGNMYAHKHDVGTLSDGRVVHEDLFDDLQAAIDLAEAEAEEAEEALQPTLPTIETKVEALQAAA